MKKASKKEIKKKSGWIQVAIHSDFGSRKNNIL